MRASSLAGPVWLPLGWPGICLFACVGCSSSSSTESATRTESPVELSGEHQVYALATSLGSQDGPSARTKETAARASGATLANMLSAGNPLLTSNGTRVRVTCGATFVAPSYAVTSAHCVSEGDIDVGAIVVEMYRPTPALDPGFHAATTLTGTFPDLSHGRLGPEQGYYADRYPCTVVSRCGTSYGTLNCDADVSNYADVALIHCDGAPGLKYGFLKIAAEDDPNAEVFMPWKHEVYDVPLVVGTDLFDHYVRRSSQDLPSNYHYFGADESGVEQNQLLPLVSIDFPDGSHHSKLSDSSVGEVRTDLLGCHGMSGSGALQPGQNGRWELLGPARSGETELGPYLCTHIPSLAGNDHGPGSTGITYASLAGTLHVYERNQAEIEADCVALPEQAQSLFLHLPCLRAHLATDNAEFAARLAAPTVASRLEYLGNPVVTLAGGQAVSVSGFRAVAGQCYRVGLDAGCTAAPCPGLVVTVEGNDVVSTSLGGQTAAPVPVAAMVTAASTGTVTLSLRAEGTNSVELGALSWRADTHANGFDTAFERLEAVLLDLEETTPLPEPMRFVGDGVQGFAAELRANEELVLTRQAIPAGRSWTVEFDAAPQTQLTCGLVDEQGRVVAEVDCSSRPATLDDSSSLLARAGFFVKTPASSPAVAIDNLRIRSDGCAGQGGAGGAGGAGGGAVGGGAAVNGGMSGAGNTSPLAGTAGVGGATGGDAPAIGGAAVTAGAPPTGGLPSMAGATPTGGVAPMGGTPAVGGITAAGGAAAAGGATLTGGTMGTGGIGGLGGIPEAGGQAESGGALTAGGSPATGGTILANGGVEVSGGAAGSTAGAAEDGGPVAIGGQPGSKGGTGGANGPLSGAGAVGRSTASGDDGGCGCRTAVGSTNHWRGWLLAAAVALVSRRRLRKAARR